MVDMTYIGNFTGGLKNDRLPFNINNDTFPTMVNMYSWRGRAKKKRGTTTLGRAEIQVLASNAQATITNIQLSNPCVITAANTFQPGELVEITGVVGTTEVNNNIYVVIAANPTTFTINIDATGFTAYTSGGTATIYTGTNSWINPAVALIAGAVNLKTAFSLPATSSITPGSISFTVGANTYTEPATPDGTLVGAPAGSGTINYATGDLTITGGGVGPLTGSFSYFPGIPIMGLENFSTSITTSAYPYLLTFDQERAYFLHEDTTTKYFYNISYYKGTNLPFTWSGLDYQQFWTTNYSNAFWATNNVPGFHILIGTYTSGLPGTTVLFNFKVNQTTNFTNLIVGDQLWFNEWSGSTDLNGVVGKVTDVSDAANGNYKVTFTVAPTGMFTTGIVQMLTNTLPGQDGLRWLDGDPTGSLGTGTGIPNSNAFGWVNFAPPLTANSVSINNTPLDKYYLVGALIVLPYKDRLLFFSPYIQSSSRAIAGLPPIQMQDLCIWSQNGTPYYTNPVPTDETSFPQAFYVDETGYGGWLAAGISQPIVTVNNNEDVLLVSFSNRQTRFVYTGNDITPFLFYAVNSELGASATYAGVSLDRGGITIGQYGIAMTNQQSAQRIDLDIPDQVFQINANDNGAFRVNAVRDYYKEWIYFTYPVNNSTVYFPTQTFLWNYRDNTWAILYENFTAQGTYRAKQSFTWMTCPFPTWNEWQEAWNSGVGTDQFPSVVGGNPQGYVLIKGQGVGEGQSGAIQTITDTGDGLTTITSYNHCLTFANPLTEDGDYIYIQGCLGTTSINGQVGKVTKVIDEDNFTVDLPFPSGTYLGLGTFARLCQPLLQTKQFNFYWEMGRQAILGVQKYLFDRTTEGQVTVNLYLSQDNTNIWNTSGNGAVVYSQIVYTCPESLNIGLTPANTNLQMPTAAGQFQIWHRMNTSLLGDTVQIGITLSEAQMKDYTLATSEIALHAIVLTSQPGPQLA